MVRGILGKKVGMTHIFDDDGRVIPVTVIEAGPCVVVQCKSEERDDPVYLPRHPADVSRALHPSGFASTNPIDRRNQVFDAYARTHDDISTANDANERPKQAAKPACEGPSRLAGYALAYPL